MILVLLVCGFDFWLGNVGGINGFCNELNERKQKKSLAFLISRGKSGVFRVSCRVDGKLMENRERYSAARCGTGDGIGPCSG